MSFRNEYLLPVDIKKRMPSPVPVFKRGDTAVLKFEVFDNGILYDLADFTRAEVHHTLPSGKTLVGNAQLENGLIVYHYTGAEMAEIGDVSTSLTIYSGTSQVSIQPFNVYMYDSMNSTELSYIGVLQDLIVNVDLLETDVEASLRNVEQAITNVENLETQVNNNENTRQSNETTRINNENNRISAETTRENNEQDRIDAENTRQTNETSRESNETTRQENEANRQTQFNDKINEINTLLPNLQGLENVESWNSTTQYYKNNIVEFNGSSFMALQDSLGQHPPTLPTKQNEYWSLLAQRGVDGTGAVSTVNGISPDVNGNVEITELKEINRLTTSVTHGTSVVSNGVDAIADVQIEGRTLTSLGNSALDSSKLYVLADKKTKVKWADGTTVNGIAKFAGKSERPSIIRVANFEGKVSGSTVENPHIMKPHWGSTLPNPSQSTSSEPYTQEYVAMSSLNGAIYLTTVKTSGGIGKQLYSYNLIEAVERNIGKIPGTTVAEKVQWLKDNVARLTVNWWGFGSSVGGNKASLKVWSISENNWFGTTGNTSSTITKVSRNEASTYIIDSNGFVHYLAYAEPSDGVTPSTINTDYVELEVELKPTATLETSKVPLYEVTQDEYNKILVDWDESKVTSLYPSVEGTKHLTNPYVIAEGENSSYLYAEVTLGQIGTNKDLLYRNDGKWFVRKVVNTDVTPPTLLPSPQTIDVTDKVEGAIKINKSTQITVDNGYTRNEEGTWSKTLTSVPATNVKLTYATNIASTVSDLVRTVENNTRDISVHNFALDYIEAQAMNNAVDLETVSNQINVLTQNIGDINTLTTTDKTNVVNAINEIDGNLASTNKYLEDISINVKDFGAVGDGITDDTNAIQNAIASVGGSGGGVVYVPSGTYKVSSLLLWTGVLLMGSDKESTIIKNDGVSTDPLIKLGGNGTRNASVENMTLNGNSTSSHGLYLIYFTNGSYINNVDIVNCQVGLYISKCWYANFSNMRITDCGTSMELDTTVEAINGVTFENIYCNRATSYNQYIHGSYGIQAVSFIGCTFENSSNYGTLMDNITYYMASINYTGCYWEGNAKASIYINSNNIRTISFNSCHMYIPSGGYGIYSKANKLIVQDVFMYCHPTNAPLWYIYSEGMSNVILGFEKNGAESSQGTHINVYTPENSTSIINFDTNIIDAYSLKNMRVLNLLMTKNSAYNEIVNNSLQIGMHNRTAVDIGANYKYELYTSGSGSWNGQSLRFRAYENKDNSTDNVYDLLTMSSRPAIINLQRARPSTTTTAGRINGVAVGQMAYDTTLLKPIWWNGTAWTDANGTVV